jgi:hypothetical protein
MKKATKHRKRHTIPGPAGILWSSSHPDEKSSHVGGGGGGGGEEDEGLTQQPLFSNNRNGDISNDGDSKKKRNKKNRGHYHDISPHAWSTMQQSLEIVTPYLPSHTQGNIKRRYELLRPHLPSNCVLLLEILRGKHDVKMTKDADDLFLCVWVESIDETNSHHGVFTVELRDETGAKIRAWIEPKFVKAELQKGAQNDDKNSEKSKSSMGVVRTGVVWMLRNVSMIVFKNNNNNSNTNNNNNSNNNNNNNIGRPSLSSSITRMLVVSENNIKEVWTPEQHMAQTQPNEEDDSPEAQRKYLDWMEKRKALVVSSPSSASKKKKKKKERQRNHRHNHDDDDGDDSDSDDEGQPEEEDYERDHDGRGSTTNGLWNQLRTEPSSPLAHRDVNNVQGYDSTIKTTTTDNSTGISGDKSQKTSDLHKQLFSISNSASAGKDEVLDSSGSHAEEISTTMTTTHLHHPSQCSTQLATQPDSPRRKHHSYNTTNQNENRQSSIGGELSNDMNDKDCEYDANGRSICSNTMTSDNEYTQEGTICNDSNNNNNNNNNSSSFHEDRSREITSQRIMPSRSPMETIDQTIHPSSISSSPSYENSQRNNDSTSSQNDIASKQKKKKVKKKMKNKKRSRDSISSTTYISGQVLNETVEMAESKKKKEAKSAISPTRRVNSPIRMAGSVWNTPDASILQMLDKEEEEETQTVTWESPAFSTQQRHPPLVSNIASRRGDANGSVEDPQSESEENDNKTRPLQSARIERGSCENMFEPSSWAGIDMSALSDDDDCNF